MKILLQQGGGKRLFQQRRRTITIGRMLNYQINLDLGEENLLEDYYKREKGL